MLVISTLVVLISYSRPSALKMVFGRMLELVYTE